MYSVFVAGEPQPVAKDNSRYNPVTGRIIVYSRDKGGIKRRWKESVVTTWRALQAPILEKNVPTFIAMEFFLTKCTGNKLSYPSQRPDLDNLCYGIVNALKNVAYYDDKQIVHQVAVKSWATETNPAGVQIRIGRIDKREINPISRVFYRMRCRNPLIQRPLHPEKLNNKGETE